MLGEPVDVSEGTAEGFAACFVSVIFFGSAFVPIKRHGDAAGDGFFVQWIMGAAIFVVGLVVYTIENFPPFYPLAMLGGVFWAIGNVTAVPILSLIGLGMGILVWGTTNCLTGWATGRFGLFGLTASVPNSIAMNYIGLAFVIIGGILFSQLKPTLPRNVVTPSSSRADDVGSVSSRDTRLADDELSSLIPTGPVLRGSNKIFVGTLMALAAGVFYGLTFVPVIYIQDHPEKYPGSPDSGLPYVFSHFCGIFLTSTAFFIAYAVRKCGRPSLNSRIVLPAYLSGTMWAVAQSAWFVANDHLSQSISFPIIAMMPGVCAALWSVFYFREIEGVHNLRLLCGAVGITVAGAILVGLSKSI